MTIYIALLIGLVESGDRIVAVVPETGARMRRPGGAGISIGEKVEVSQHTLLRDRGERRAFVAPGRELPVGPARRMQIPLSHPDPLSLRKVQPPPVC